MEIAYNGNENDPRLAGVIGLNSHMYMDSATRLQMFGSHIGQNIPLCEPSGKSILAGPETQYATTTFSIKMPEDGIIKRIISRYPQTQDIDSVEFNPERIVFYVSRETGVYGIIKMPRFCSKHQYFGFDYITKPGMNLLIPDTYVEKGTVFADPPSVSSQGVYNYGREFNICFLSIPGVSEDGIVISKSALKKLRFKIYERRTVEYGSRFFPTNLYGTPDNYKAFPDIGETIKSSGLLMNLRPIDKMMSPVMMSKFALCKVDPVFDKGTYCSVPGNKQEQTGRVIDIEITTNRVNGTQIPFGVEKGLDKYVKHRKRFYQEIYAYWREINRQNKDVQISGDFHILLMEALKELDANPDTQLIKTYRKKQIDETMITFVIEHLIVPTIGYKETDIHGGKGVICSVREDEDMPMDADGNRADLVFDPKGRIARMNPGGNAELYTNAYSRDVAKTIRSMLGFDRGTDTRLNAIKQKDVARVFDNDKERAYSAFNHLLRYYQITSPKHYGVYKEATDEQIIQHLSHICKYGIVLYIPTNNQVRMREMVTCLKREFKTCYGPVSYRDLNGNVVTTKEKVRIGRMYIISLEKIGSEWNAVSSAVLQPHGLIAQKTKSTKYSSPARKGSTRTYGETESRIVSAVCGPLTIAEIFDRNNSPTSHRACCETIMRSYSPTDIPELVDRKLYSFGSAKPLQIVNHMMSVGGVKFKYDPSVFEQLTAKTEQ